MKVSKLAMTTPPLDTAELTATLVSEGVVRFFANCPRIVDEAEKAELLSSVAKIVSESKTDLVLESIDQGIAAIPKERFFEVQNVLVELIPLLEVDHHSLMILVDRLVHAGGNDLAAHWPNSALREWLRQDNRRSAAVYGDARRGDHLAIQHLTFALEAAADVENALTFLDSHDADVRKSAITALGRIEPVEDAIAIVERLAEVAGEDPDVSTALMALHSGFAILSRDTSLEREAMRNALVQSMRELTPDKINLAASILANYGNTLRDDERQTCLNAVLEVRSQDHGTLSLLDLASRRLVGTNGLADLSAAIRRIIDKSEGEIGLEAFDGFLHGVRSADPETLGRVVVDWLLEGGTHSRSDIASALSDIGISNPPFAVPNDVIPPDAPTQLFLCRKSVGFFFISPITALAIPLTILQHGDPAIAGEVLDLIYNPLLLSYGGSLCDYLKSLSSKDHDRASDLHELVARRSVMLDKAEECGNIPELLPSETQRQLERTRWADKMSESMQSAESKSPLSGLFRTQHLLYGRSAAFYVIDGSGHRRMQEMSMQQHSVQTELPLLDSLDSVGLGIALHEMRFQERPSD